MTKGYEIQSVDEIKASIIAFLCESIHGTFTQACQKAGISRSEGYTWLKEDPQFQVDVTKARTQAVSSGVDYVEGKLMQAINEGNVTAMIFYLKCQGKDRGYIDRVIHGFDKDNPPPPVQVIRDARAEFRLLLESLATARSEGRPLSITMVAPSETEPGDAEGGLARMADNGGQGLGKN